MNKVLNMTDKTAIVLSFVCVLHCLALPVLLIALPSISTLINFDNEIIHFGLILAVVPISLFAVISGYIHHRHTSVFFISTIGIIMLIVAVIYGHDVLGDSGETLLTIVGSALITFGHLRNFRLRRVYHCEKPIGVSC